eukprot:gene13082-14425_t
MDLLKVFRDIMPVPGGKQQYPAMSKESTTISSPVHIDMNKNKADWINPLRQIDDEHSQLNEMRVSFSAFFGSKHIAQWMFALDHVHYARWLPVFIEDVIRKEQIKEGGVFKHNEGANLFEERFTRDRKSFLDAFWDLGIPFQEKEASLAHIGFPVLGDAACDSETSGEEIGKKPRSADEFMRHNVNKTETFKMLAEKIINDESDQTTTIATMLEKAISNRVGANLSRIQNWNHKEADTRLLLHVLAAAKNGHKSISIITVDPGVVVFALNHFSNINIKEIWVDIGINQHRRWLFCFCKGFTGTSILVCTQMLRHTIDVCSSREEDGWEIMA